MVWFAFAESSTERVVFEYKDGTMQRGNVEYQAFPVVIEPKVDELRNVDVVYIETEDGEQKLTRIVGLPGEKAAIRNETVVVNTIPFDIFGALLHKRASKYMKSI